jgi:hypothetical protein
MQLFLYILPVACLIAGFFVGRLCGTPLVLVTKTATEDHSVHTTTNGPQAPPLRFPPSPGMRPMPNKAVPVGLPIPTELPGTWKNNPAKV